MSYDKPDIIVPTCLDDKSVPTDLTDMLYEYNNQNRIIMTCMPGSAATNRNLGLNFSRSEIVIMMDDDIRGLFLGWDMLLIEPLLRDNAIVYVSARLLDSNGNIAPAMGAPDDTRSSWVECATAPSACVAFRNTDLRFDENYVGSGWEDTDFVRQLKMEYPKGKIVVNNMVKLVHLNEMKNQRGENYEKNRKFYNSKWGANE